MAWSRQPRHSEPTPSPPYETPLYLQRRRRRDVHVPQQQPREGVHPRRPVEQRLALLLQRLLRPPLPRREPDVPERGVLLEDVGAQAV